LAATLRCVSVAPFAIPVVPPVYCRNATSSSRMDTGASGLAFPASTTRLKRIDAGSRYGFTAFFT
jgi:hypothetical protein